VLFAELLLVNACREPNFEICQIAVAIERTAQGKSIKGVCTAEPPVSDHPKCQAQVVAYGKLSLTRVQTIMGENFSSLEYGNYRDFPNAAMPMQCFIDVKVNFEKKKNSVLPIKKFPFLVPARTTIMFQHLIIRFLLCYLSSGRLQEVKNKGKFRTVSSKSGRGRL